MSIYVRQKRYFAQAYETGEHGWPTTEPSDIVGKFFKNIKSRVPRARVLDLGCGEGRHTLLAARHGFHAIGLDYQPLAIERAMRFAKDEGITGGFSFLIGDVFHPPFQEKNFDVLIDFGCLHHIKKKDFPRYLEAILNLLRPHGYYLLSCFSTQFKHYAGEKRVRNWLVHRGHYDRFFRKQDFKVLFGTKFDRLDYNLESDGMYVFHQVLMQRRG